MNPNKDLLTVDSKTGKVLKPKGKKKWRKVKNREEINAGDRLLTFHGTVYDSTTRTVTVAPDYIYNPESTKIPVLSGDAVYVTDIDLEYVDVIWRWGKRLKLYKKETKVHVSRLHQKSPEKIWIPLKHFETKDGYILASKIWSGNKFKIEPNTDDFCVKMKTPYIKGKSPSGELHKPGKKLEITVEKKKTKKHKKNKSGKKWQN